MSKKNKHSQARKRRIRELKRQAHLHRSNKNGAKSAEEPASEVEVTGASQAGWQKRNLVSAIMMFAALMTAQIGLWLVFRVSGAEQQLIELFT